MCSRSISFMCFQKFTEKMLHSESCSEQTQGQLPKENRQEKEKLVLSVLIMDFQWSKDMPESFSAFILTLPLFLMLLPKSFYFSIYYLCLLIKLSNPLGLRVFKAGGLA